MVETLKLCVSCKGCRRECPTGVDMAQDEDRGAGGAGAKTRAFAAATGWSAICRAMRRWPRACPGSPICATSSPLLRKAVREIRRLQRAARLPQWRARRLQRPMPRRTGPADGREVVLFADTFNRYFERENLDAALRVLVEPAAIACTFAKPADGERGRCAAAGRFSPPGWSIRRARECERTGRRRCAPFAARGVPVVGLEPSCLLTLRDEVLVAAIRTTTADRASARMRCCSRNFWRARPRPAASSCRSERCRESAAARPLPPESPSARSARSSRCCGWFPG